LWIRCFLDFCISRFLDLPIPWFRRLAYFRKCNFMLSLSLECMISVMCEFLISQHLDFSVPWVALFLDFTFIDFPTPLISYVGCNTKAQNGLNVAGARLSLTHRSFWDAFHDSSRVASVIWAWPDRRSTMIACDTELFPPRASYTLCPMLAKV
jgi:hypothetical protein